MATNFPTTLDTFSNPTGTDLLENATTALDHDFQHTHINDAVLALQTKVGINGSAVNTTIDYKLSGVITGDKAVSKTGTETLTNKTLTAPVINIGSDATGDMYYRNGSGLFTRLVLGTVGQILNVDGSGIPAWVANPAAADASTTVKGVSEIATTAEITAGTATGGTGAVLVVPASAVGAVGASKIVQFNSSAQYPAADGSLITNITNPITYKNNSTSKNLADASTTQTIAHGLGKAPKCVEIVFHRTDGTAFATFYYNGTTKSVVGYALSNAAYRDMSGSDIVLYELGNNTQFQTGVLSFDATNISIVWTKSNSPTGTYGMNWRAEA